jgi:hypothetical protein
MLMASSASVDQRSTEHDLVIEYGGGRVAGLEIKASAAPKSSDARDLVWLREELGDSSARHGTSACSAQIDGSRARSFCTSLVRGDVHRLGSY